MKIKIRPNFEIEKIHGDLLTVGVDEVGRGSIAGPVVAATVYLNSNLLKDEFYKNINDSKKILPKKRGEIFLKLIEISKYGIGIVDEDVVDKINVLEASKLAMYKSYKNFVEKYGEFPEIILVDGNFIPFKKMDKIKNIYPIVKGDQKSLSIAAASIIAKETRDKIMKDFHKEYHHYSFDKNAGYPTKFHIQKIKEFGICKIHRKSFGPIKSIVSND